MDYILRLFFCESLNVCGGFMHVAVMQIRRMCMRVRQPLVIVGVGMYAVHQGHIFRMGMILVFIGMLVRVGMLKRLVNVVVIMVFAQHQPCPCCHDQR